MKLLTLNTHSLMEENYEEKLKYFIEVLEEKKYDVIALQEVNQSHGDNTVSLKELFSLGYIPCEENILIKEDNHIYNIVKALREKGCDYFWSWCPIKLGYEKYDEGIGMLTKIKPEQFKTLYITNSHDFYNWKTRKIIGTEVKTERGFKWFYSIHMGWWNDTEEGFLSQWEKLEKYLDKENDIYLMGDFNNPAEIKGEGYSKIICSGWKDSYDLAESKDNGITVSGLIDGWKDKKDLEQMRIDFIFKNKTEKVLASKVIFNGKNKNIISDHFGIEIEE